MDNKKLSKKTKEQERLEIYNQRLSFLYYYKEFQDDLRKIKNDNFKCVNGLLVVNSEKLYKNELDKLLKKYKLPLSLRERISMTVGYDHSHEMARKFSLKFYSCISRMPSNALKRFSIIEKENRLFIEIYADTAIKDLASAWREISKMQKKLPGYNFQRERKLHKYDRNLRIWELYQNRESDKNILKILRSEFPEENLGYIEIRNILADIKKKYNMP